MILDNAHVIRANARSLPLADNTVDLVVTSPPYFALRSYQDGGEHYAGQIGDEHTPAEFVASLIEVTRECVRVLKPSGSLWVNLGDKYSGAQAQNIGGVNRAGNSARTWAQTDPKRTGIPNKSLCGIPWRYALRCIDDLGLILRAEVIWSKPNGLPESVTDRVRRSHEQWFHFVAQPRYFSAVDAGWSPAGVCVECGEGRRPVVASVSLDLSRPQARRAQELADQAGLTEAHFQALLSVGVSDTGRGKATQSGTGKNTAEVYALADKARESLGGYAREYLLRRPSGFSYACACPAPTAPTTPAVVLDPFGGTGTTAMVAKALGRTGISVDMSADYCRLAQWRTNDRNQLAKVLGVEKVTAPDPEQMDLFGGVA